jgi:hypothetical protein
MINSTKNGLRQKCHGFRHIQVDPLAGVRPFAGVDVSHYLPGEGGERVWVTWVQAAMGLTSSPYQSVQGMAFTEEMIF